MGTGAMRGMNISCVHLRPILAKMATTIAANWPRGALIAVPGRHRLAFSIGFRY